MPVNRFDNPVGQRYVSTHVPLPFEELAAVAKQYQDKYDRNRHITDEIDSIGKAIKAAPMYEDHRQQFLNEYRGKINNLVNKTNDYGSYYFQKQALDLVNEFKSRPEINAFTNTLKSYEDWEKIRQNRDSQRDLDFTYDKDNTGSFRQRNVLKEGVYTPNFTKYADSAKASEDIMKGIASDAGGYGNWDLGTTKQMQDGYHYAINKQSGKWEKLTDDKLKSVANINIPNYARTDAGLFRIREMLNSDSADYDTLRAMTKTKEGRKLYDDVTKELYNDLYSTGYKQVFGKSYQDQDINILSDDNAKDAIKEQRENAVMQYDSPANTVKGIGISDSFDAHSGYNTNAPVGGPSIMGTTPYNGKIDVSKAKPKFMQPRDMDAKTKEFTENAIKQLDPSVYTAYKKTGVLSDAMMNKIYPVLKTMKAELEKDILVGSTVQSLDEHELKQMKGFFGSEKQEVKDLGTGLGINATYFIPSTGEKLTYTELKEKFPEDSKVAIEGKYLPTNPFVKLTNDKNFANGRQLSIDGVEIVVSGPKKFIDRKTGASSVQDFELEKNRNVNTIYNAKFTPNIPVEEKIYNKNVKLLYMPDKENPDYGAYRLLDKKNNVILNPANPEGIFNSAEEVEDFVIKNLQSIKD